MNKKLTRSEIFQQDGKIINIPVYNWGPVQGCAMRDQCPVNNCWAAGQCRRWYKQWTQSEIDWWLQFAIHKYYPVRLKVLKEEKRIEIENNFKKFRQQFLEYHLQKLFPKEASIILVGWRSDIAGWPQAWKHKIINKIVVDNDYRMMMGWKKHVFLFLTKWPSLAYTVPMPQNCWLGWTVTEEKYYQWRYWGNVQNENYFLLSDPLKGHLGSIPIIDNFRWIVAGGGDGVPLEPEWVRPIRDKCNEKKIPFWFKGWGEWLPDRQTASYKGQKGEITETHKRCFVDIGHSYAKVGKKNAGNLLDGEIWHEIPDFWENL